MTTARKPNSRRPGGKPVSGYTDLDAYAAEATWEPFKFKWADREWFMVHQREIDTWDIIRDDEELEGLSRNEQILELFELGLQDQWAEFKDIRLPLGVMDKLFDDYNAYCGTSPGEGKRSAGS